ncbi:MAG: LamG-like jellyroll fold domain-containing protein [Candidatus Microsaccharimonas sp.]
MQWVSKNKQAGFTIVELLIVIVVIAILAAITIAAYNGISNRAKQSSLQSTLTNYAKKIEVYRTSASNASESYPANLSDAGLASPSDATLSYGLISSSNFYCLDGQIDSYQYFITSIDSKVRPGTCPSANNLVGWWPLNGSAVNMATGDSTAVAVGVTPVDGQGGRAGGAYSFSGVATSSYIDTKHISSRTQFTASLWIYSTASSGYRTPLSEVRDCCGSGYRGFEIKSSYSGASVGSVSVWAGGAAAAKGTNGIATIPLNTWTFLTATYDGTTLTYYENGAFVRTSAYVGDPGTSINTLMIGRAGAVAAGGFAGSIDDVRVYTRALSPTEIQNLFQIGAL